MKNYLKWLISIGLILIIVFLVYVAFFNNRQSQQNDLQRLNNSETKNQNNSLKTKQNCVGEDCLQVNNLNYPAGELSEDTKIALIGAIEDEYKARAVYQKVIDKFGNVRPFIMIIRAEEQHISLLKALFDKYGMIVPQDKTKDLPQLDSLTSACKIGVDAEIANADLYQNELLPKAKQYEDITVVFTNLMNASRQNHLPSFQKCAN